MFFQFCGCFVGRLLGLRGKVLRGKVLRGKVLRGCKRGWVAAAWFEGCLVAVVWFDEGWLGGWGAGRTDGLVG